MLIEPTYFQTDWLNQIRLLCRDIFQQRERKGVVVLPIGQRIIFAVIGTDAGSNDEEELRVRDIVDQNRVVRAYFLLAGITVQVDVEIDIVVLLHDRKRSGVGTRDILALYIGRVVDDGESARFQRLLQRFADGYDVVFRVLRAPGFGLDIAARFRLKIGLRRVRVVDQHHRLVIKREGGRAELRRDVAAERDIAVLVDDHLRHRRWGCGRRSGTRFNQKRRTGVLLG